MTDPAPAASSTDLDVLAATRRTLHGVAELVVAGPQHRRSGEIALLVTPGGFRGVTLPLQVEGASLVADGVRLPLTGTYRSLAEAAGVDVGAPRDLYADVTGIDPDEELVLDADALALVTTGWEWGDRALRLFAPQESPVLWPEHFDVGIALDGVNYGVSPGDGFQPLPYAYVAPWEVPSGSGEGAEGGFWDAPFGSARTIAGFADVDAVVAYFEQGRQLAAGH